MQPFETKITFPQPVGNGAFFFQINFLSFSSFNSKDIFLTESVRKIRALVVLIFVGVIIFSMVLIKSSQQALIRLT